MHATLLALFALALIAAPAHAGVVKNGFELEGGLIPPSEILHGGPPRDAIPALTAPRFVAAGEARWLADDDRVLGLQRGGIAKAYPIAILNWHELVNDRLGDEPVVVTYCPLCGTGMVFAARSGGRPLTFGVSGLLYNSDVLFYDHQSDSLWSQLLRQAVTGPEAGAQLEMLAVSHTTWADWRARHPETRVLSRETGYARDYDRNPYGGYDRDERLFFPVANVSRRYHPKEQVLGVSLGGLHKAYPFSELAAQGSARIDDVLAGRRLTVTWDDVHRTARVFDGEGTEIPAVTAFWFAWYGFHPETGIYRAPSQGAR